MRIDVVSIFPDYLAPLKLSLVGKAISSGLVDVGVHDLRDWTHDRHRTVDDTPYGGGAGMVMRPEPWGEALDDLLSPDGGESQVRLLSVKHRTLRRQCGRGGQTAHDGVKLFRNQPGQRALATLVAPEDQAAPQGPDRDRANQLREGIVSASPVRVGVWLTQPSPHRVGDGVLERGELLKAHRQERGNPVQQIQLQQQVVPGLHFAG